VGVVTSGGSTDHDGVRLTPREREVIDLIAEGLSNRAIGERLHISVHTVKSHLRNIMDKLTLNSRLQIAAYVHQRDTDAEDLRRRAEARVEEDPRAVPTELEGLSLDQVRGMLHELQVHQIELEMQNEELRQSRAELEASHERYFDLFDLAPVGYFTLTEDAQILEANLTGSKAAGRAPKRPAGPAVHPVHPPRRPGRLLPPPQGGRQRRLPGNLRAPDGASRREHLPRAPGVSPLSPRWTTARPFGPS
jgi:DNA-binding CsgD family transcriptional regulator